MTSSPAPWRWRFHDQARRHGTRRARRVPRLSSNWEGHSAAALASRHGRIVDGLGGSSGPLGSDRERRLDGEVGVPAGQVTKQMIFSARSARSRAPPARGRNGGGSDHTRAGKRRSKRYLESIVKAVAEPDCVGAICARSCCQDVSRECRRSMEVDDAIVADRARRISRLLSGFATVAKHTRAGAALLADGLAGGSASGIVDALGIREASGTVLDHLFVISPDAARRRLGIE